MKATAIEWSADHGRQRWQPAIVLDDGVMTYYWRRPRPNGRRMEKWAIVETIGAHPALYDTKPLALAVATAEMTMRPLRKENVAVRKQGSIVSILGMAMMHLDKVPL